MIKSNGFQQSESENEVYVAPGGSGLVLADWQQKIVEDFMPNPYRNGNFNFAGHHIKVSGLSVVVDTQQVGRKIDGNWKIVTEAGFSYQLAQMD